MTKASGRFQKFDCGTPANMYYTHITGVAMNTNQHLQYLQYKESYPVAVRLAGQSRHAEQLAAEHQMPSSDFSPKTYMND